MRYEFHPEALAEYEQAALYYAGRDPEVGERFVVAVEDAIDRILDSPARWRVLEEDVRRCLTRVFPAFLRLAGTEKEPIRRLAFPSLGAAWRLRYTGAP